jgi:hypothetical protein
MHGEGGDAVSPAPGIGSRYGHDGVPGRLACIADPAFRAVEHPVRAILARRGPHGHGVVAGFAFAERVTGAGTVRDVWEYLFLEGL